jgi:hypothetical protein
MEGEEEAQAVIDLPADRETGLRVGRIVFYGPVGSGKTLLAVAVGKMMSPPSFEEIYILSPVATAANNWPQAQWYQISPTDKTRVNAFMEEMKKKRALLVVDEADSYCGGSARSFGTPGMFEAVLFGRNACLSMLIIAHGTSLAPKAVVANAEALFFFRTTEPNLLEYAKDYMVEIPDVEHTLRNLPRHVALIYAPNGENKFVGGCKLNLDTGQIEVMSGEDLLRSMGVEEATSEETSDSTTGDESSPPRPAPASPHGSITPPSSTPEADGKSTV